jgi:hypothetical protein
LVVTEEKSQLWITFSLLNLVYIPIRPITTSPESLVKIGGKIFLAFLSLVPPSLGNVRYIAFHFLRLAMPLFMYISIRKISVGPRIANYGIDLLYIDIFI